MFELLLSPTHHLQLESNTILRCEVLVVLSGLELVGVSLEWEQAQTMDEQLIRDDGCILVEEYFVKGHCGYFSDYDPAQSVGQGGINPN